MANTENILALPEGYVLHERYKIEKILGAGGFGITYKAKDTLNKSFCAVKEYVPLGICTRYGNGNTLCATGEMSKEHYEHGKMRFMEEAQVLLEVASIPNIVRVMDYFEENGTAYYVMEYLSGMTLKEFRKKYPDKRIPFPIAYEILEIVGNSLDKVHSRYHLLHRDISPDNIFITKDGVIKLIDFGSAKHICRNGNQKFTVVLKEGYAPPEQYRQNFPQGAYTDVYALASTFYHVICGKMLPTSMERIAGTTYEPAYVLAPGVTRQMSAVLDKALHTDYKRRYQTVEAFLRELKAAVELPAATASPAVGKAVPPVERGSETIYVYEKKKLVFKYRMNVDQMIGVGRERDGNSIVIPGHREISRTHCYIEYDSQGRRFLVKNVSTNGTFYRGKLLEKDKVYSIQKGENIDLAGVYTLELGERV